jgi:hypothetical protein
VQVQLPSQVRGADLQLRREDADEVVPLQIGPYREAWAMLPRLRAGTTTVFRIEPALRPALTDRVSATRDVSQVRVTIEGQDGAAEIVEAAGCVLTSPVPQSLDLLAGFGADLLQHGAAFADDDGLLARLFDDDVDDKQRPARRLAVDDDVDANINKAQE